MKKITLLLTTALLWFAVYVYNPYLTPELLSLSLSASVAGVIVGTRPFMQMFVRFPMGLLSDRSGRHRRLIIAGNIFSCAAGFLMFLFPTPAIITVGCLIAGFASATYVAYTVLYGAYYPRGRLSVSMGVIGTVEYAATTAAFFFGGILYKSQGIRSVFLLAGIAGAAGIVSSFLVEDTQLPPAKETRSALKALTRNPELRISCVMGILVKLVAFGTAFSFVTKLADNLHLSGALLGLATGSYIAAAAVGSIFAASRAAKRVGHLEVCFAGFAVLAAYSAGLPWIKDVVWFTVLQAAAGFSFGSLSSIIMANAVRTLPVNQKSAGMGFYQSVYSLGMGMGSVLVGFFAEAVSLEFGFIVMGVASVGAMFVVRYASAKQLMTGSTRRSRRQAPQRVR